MLECSILQSSFEYLSKFVLDLSPIDKKGKKGLCHIGACLNKTLFWCSHLHNGYDDIKSTYPLLGKAKMDKASDKLTSAKTCYFRSKLPDGLKS